MIATTDRPGAFQAKLSDPSKWRRVPGVIAFDEHDESHPTHADGTPAQQAVIERFDRDRLERMAANCNQLADRTGINLTLGHTTDRGREEDQPVSVGWAKAFRVVFNPTLGRHVITYDELYDPETFERYQISQYPWRSVERFRRGGPDGAGYFWPIALLKRTPARPLGPVQYRRGEQVVRYSMAAFSQSASHQLFEGRPITRKEPTMKVETFQTRRDGIDIPEPLRMSRDLAEAALRYQARNGGSFADAAQAVRAGAEIPVSYAADASTVRYASYVDLGFRAERAQRYAAAQSLLPGVGQRPDPSLEPNAEWSDGNEQTSRIDHREQYLARKRAMGRNCRKYGVPQPTMCQAYAMIDRGQAQDEDDAIRILKDHADNAKRFSQYAR